MEIGGWEGKGEGRVGEREGREENSEGKREEDYAWERNKGERVFTMTELGFLILILGE